MRFCSELAAAGVVAVDSFDALLRSARFRRLEPQLVIQVGGCPTSRAWGGWLAEQAGCRHWVLAADGWNDAESTASHLLMADLEVSLASLTTRLPARREASAWGRLWSEAETLGQAAIDAELAAPDAALSEGAVARALVEAVPAGSLLAVGNSLPIRHIDTYGRGSGVDLRVWSQRGASGIDGIVSGVFGAASVWRHRVALLIGDVSFLHDLSGLHAARHVQVPVVIVVVQNHGGRIFEQLPLATSPAARGSRLDHWTTPHDLDASHAAAMYGLSYRRVEARAELDEALAAGFEQPGGALIEALVPDHGAVEQNRRLWQRIERAFSTSRAPATAGTVAQGDTG